MDILTTEATLKAESLAQEVRELETALQRATLQEEARQKANPALALARQLEARKEQLKHRLAEIVALQAEQVPTRESTEGGEIEVARLEQQVSDAEARLTEARRTQAQLARTLTETRAKYDTMALREVREVEEEEEEEEEAEEKMISIYSSIYLYIYIM